MIGPVASIHRKVRGSDCQNPSTEEYPGRDYSLIVGLFQASDLSEKAITALYHNIICINAHNKQTIGGGAVSILVSHPLHFGGTCPPSPGIDVTVG